MDKTNKAIAIGVAVGIVVAVLLVSVIIPEIKQANLRHQINQQAEMSESVDEVLCRSNMRTLAACQERFKADGGLHRYASSLDGLLDSPCLDGMDINTDCPEDYGDEYDISLDYGDDKYTITCPNGHGSIVNGECSWVQEY